MSLSIEIEPAKESLTNTAVALTDREHANQILNSYRAAIEAAGHAKTKGQHAVQLALATGALLLIREEEVGHGDWLTWFRKYCPEIGKKTAQRWMKLAEKSASADFKNDIVSLLKEAKTCKQAYLAVGMIPDEEKNTTGKEPATFLSMLLDLRDSSQFKALADDDLSGWTEEDLEAVDDAFSPLLVQRDRFPKWRERNRNRHRHCAGPPISIVFIRRCKCR